MVRSKLNIPKGMSGAVWKGEQPFTMTTPHTHKELEMNLVLSGKARYIAEKRVYDLRQESMIWLFPAQPHLLVEASDDFTMWIIVFQKTLVKRFAKDRMFSGLALRKKEGNLCRNINPADAKKLNRLSYDLNQTTTNKMLFNSGLEYLLLDAWRIFTVSRSEPNFSSVHPSVSKAAQIMMDGNLNLEVTELAKMCGLSRSALSRLFRAQTGITIVNFRNRLRLKKFFDVYGTGHRYDMYSACLEAGFGSYAQFYRIFSQELGTGPGKYFKQQ